MLKVSGQIIVHRTPGDLWRLLMDPVVLRKCLPKCEEFEEISPRKFRVSLKMGVGLIRSRFRGEAELKDVVEGEGYRFELFAKGTGGSVEGATVVRLASAAEGSKTELYYVSDARVSGLIASMGAKLFEGTARSLAEQFFDEISKL